MTLSKATKTIIKSTIETCEGISPLRVKQKQYQLLGVHEEKTAARDCIAQKWLRRCWLLNVNCFRLNFAWKDNDELKELGSKSNMYFKVASHT